MVVFSRAMKWFKIGLVVLTCMLTSCVSWYTQKTTFDYVRKQMNTSDYLFGWRTAYYGSDNKYDYYKKWHLFFPQCYAVPTTPHLFYPGPIPFRGWNKKNAHYFHVYRGNIVIISLKQHYELVEYIRANNHRFKKMDKGRLVLDEVNKHAIKRWGVDRLRIPKKPEKEGGLEWGLEEPYPGHHELHLFGKNNDVGQHIILYKYGDFQRTLVVNVKAIVQNTGTETKPQPQRIDIMFSQLDQLRSQSFKIPELIDAISAYYVKAPTLCMAAIRILVEASCKSFFQFLKNEENDTSFESNVNKVINLQKCDERDNDYKEYVLQHNPDFILEFKNISEKYNVALSKDVKNNINSHMKEVDLNRFIHNPLIVTTDTTVFQSMQIFSPLLNYIFDVLLMKSKK